MNEPTELERLLLRLEELQFRSRSGDAIDEILASPPRATRVTSLRNHQAVEKFRGELRSGTIGMETANRFLSLVRALLEAAAP